MSEAGHVAARLAAFLACLLAQPAGAEQQGPARSPAGQEVRDEAGVPFGPFRARAGIELQVGRNDNLLLQSANALSSNVSIFAPGVALEEKSGANAIDFRYRGEFARYSASVEDDYADHLLQTNALFVFTGRLDARLRAEQLHGHDARGATDRGVSTEPDRFRQTTASGLVGFGAQNAQGRIELDGTGSLRTYKNNRAFTAASDRRVSDVGATFFWRVAPKTRALFQARYMGIDYALDASTQSSVETRSYVGLQWDATAATQGFVKVGAMKKEFTSAARADQSGGSWDLGVRWSPLSYASVDVASSRSFVESTGLGDAIVSARYSAAWTHAWSSRLSHTLSYAKIKDDFVGGGATRRDDTDAIGAKINYTFARNLRFGLEYNHSERDSNSAAYLYKRNLIFVSAVATI